jgi:hypothetical protein
MKQFKVLVSNHHSFITMAKNKNDAKEKAWDEMKNTYRYGWENKNDFIRKVIIEEL